MNIEIRKIQPNEAGVEKFKNGGSVIWEYGYYAITPFGIVINGSLEEVISDVYTEDGSIAADAIKHYMEDKIRVSIDSLPLSRYCFLGAIIGETGDNETVEGACIELIEDLLNKPNLFSGDAAYYIAHAMTFSSVSSLKDWARKELDSNPF